MVNVLAVRARPVVIFNPSDKDHRNYYYSYYLMGSSAHCPVRFSESIPFLVKKLADYYSQKEFGKNEGNK